MKARDWKRWGRAKRITKAQAAALVDEYLGWIDWVAQGDTLVAVGMDGTVYRCRILDSAELPPQKIHKGENHGE